MKEKKNPTHWPNTLQYLSSVVTAILVIGWFAFGDARGWMTAWLGDSGHFVSGLKVGMILVAISLPGVMLSVFFAIRSRTNDDNGFSLGRFVAYIIGLIIGISFVGFINACATWGLVLAVTLFASHWWLGLGLISAGVLLLASRCSAWLIGRGAESVEDSRLKQSLEKVFDKTDVLIDKVKIIDSDEMVNCVIDARRGIVIIGKKLLDGLTDDELEAILLHEAGHYVDRRCFFVQHYFRIFAIPILAFAVIAVLGNTQSTSEALMTAPYVWMLLVSSVHALINPFFSVLANLFRHHREFAADAFALRHVNRETLIAALWRLDALAAAAAPQNQFCWNIFTSHPRMEKRVRKLLEK